MHTASNRFQNVLNYQLICIARFKNIELCAMAGFCRNDVKNLTLPNKNLSLLSNVRFSTLFQPITKRHIRSFSSTFPILFWGFEKIPLPL